MMARPLPLDPPPKPNRKKWPFVGTLDFQGLTIHVENAAGDTREGVDPDGHPWKTTMHWHYGEFADTLGVDGDPVDVYIGPDPEAPTAYVVHQKVPGTQVFDEDKVMIGFGSAEEARKAYALHYDKPGFYGGMTPWPVSELREYLRTRKGGNRLDSPLRVRKLLKAGDGHWLLHWRPLTKAEQLELFGPRQVKVKPHTRVTSTGKVVPVEGHTRHVGPSLTEREVSRALYGLRREGLPEDDLSRLVDYTRARGDDLAPDLLGMGERLARLSGYLPYREPDPALPFREQIADVEDQIRSRTHEHLGIWIDGTFYRSGPEETERLLQAQGWSASTTNVCAVPADAIEFLATNGWEGRRIVVTHNHPTGSPLSTQDLYLAMQYDMDEIRAATTDGTWIARRPINGWNQRTLQKHDRITYMGVQAAHQRMDDHIRAQGGDPYDEINATGYSEQLFRKWRAEAMAAFWREYADADLPPLEREPARARPAGGHGDGLPGAGSPLTKGRLILLRKARPVSVRPHLRDGHLVRGHTRQLIGSTWPAPERHGGEFTVHAIENGVAEVRHADGQRAFMPAESVEHYSRDLRAHLDHPPTSGDHAVDHVLEGGGEFVGKGNDGLVWRSHDEAVKVSTTVPYQPRNPGHRTPQEALEHLRNEHTAHLALGDLPHVPPVRGLEHDGRYWLMKPWMEPAGALTREELDEVAGTLEQMHQRGWTLGDTVQLGRDADTGQLQLMDLGQAHSNAQPHEIEHDLERLDWLYRQHGHSRHPTPEKAAEQMAMQRVLVDLAVRRGMPERALAHFTRWKDAHRVVSYDALDDDARWEALQDEHDELEARVQALTKARVRAHVRRTKSGKLITVNAHERRERLTRSKLGELVEGFLAKYPHEARRWADPYECAGLCDDASDALVNHLEHAGYEAETVQERRNTPGLSAAHSVVEVGEWRIDLTARQYDEDAEFPRIY